MSILRHQGSVDIGDLTQVLRDVSRVTLRRDIAEMAENGLLRRTHGGATLPDGDALALAAANDAARTAARAEQLSDYAAVVMGPLEGRGSNALRRAIQHMELPFIAESAPQDGGRYLGPDNYQAGFALGQCAGRRTNGEAATVLHVCVNDLANTDERSNGFDSGFRDTFAGKVSTLRVNGQGHFRVAKRVATEALRTRPDITVGFGVNDHSAMALVEAAEREGSDLSVYSVGGEDPRFVARVKKDGPLQAVAALFPEVVGAVAVDTIVEMMTGRKARMEPVLTPHQIVTADNFDEIYETTTVDGTTLFELRPEVAEIGARDDLRQLALGRDPRLLFVPHYPSHEWYRLMGAAMEDRGRVYGIAVDIAPPQDRIAREVTRLRLHIANHVAERILPGQTVVIGQGESCRLVAAEVARRATDDAGALDGTTVITNSLEVLNVLTGIPGLKVLLTAGELQRADQCLVGPSVGALFERLRADVAFVSIDGVTTEFGLSMVDERLAQTTLRSARAAKRVVALADHICIGVDAIHRALEISEFDELVTDDGVLPDDRERLREAGVVVTIVNEEDYDLHHSAGKARSTLSGRRKS